MLRQFMILLLPPVADDNAVFFHVVRASHRSGARGEGEMFR